MRGDKLPVHVAIIMDGNGRWAIRRNLPRTEGHKRGAERVDEVINLCLDLGIPYLTLFTFSMENWQRPKEEVSTLMELLYQAIRNYAHRAHEQQIRVYILGDKNKLPANIRDSLDRLEAETTMYSRLFLTLAISYSGRWEIVETTRKILSRGEKISPEVVNEEFWQACMPSAHLPPVDLLIRTGGELRISNFMLWQCAYAEFYFTRVLWPDFGKAEFLKAIESWRKRERRFGRI